MNAAVHRDTLTVDINLQHIYTLVTMNEDGISFARRMIRQQKAESTQAQYQSSLGLLKKWLLSHHPSAVVDGKIMLPLSRQVLEEYFGESSRWTSGPRCGQLKSAAAMNGYRNAIKSLYVEERVESIDFDTFIKEYMAGYKREVAKKKQIGEMKMSEGRSPLTFEGYRLIAQKALHIEDNFNTMSFAHTFTLLTWNLMARSVSIADLKFCHISWEMDALIFNIPKQKNDQEGARAYPRHVYANPDDPIICPVLSIALKLFCSVHISNLSNDTMNVFPGNHEESRYSEWLQNLLKNLSVDETMLLGTAIEEIGNHSFRKGVASHLSNSPGGPSPISIFLRIGWNLGNVPHRYLFEGQGGDQFCGRVAAGLPLTESKFCILPPHFRLSELSLLLTDDDWTAIVPSYEQFPQSFRRAIPYLLASIVYHKDFLQANLSKKHPLFQTRLWRNGYIQRLEPHVVIMESYCPYTQMRSTGIPPTMLYLQLMKQRDRELHEKMDEIYNVLHDQLCKIDVDLDRIPESTCHAIQSRFVVDGAIPLTRDDLMQTLNDLRSSIVADMNNNMGRGASVDISCVTDAHLPEYNSENYSGRLFVWSDGSMRRAPEDWTFPSINCKTMWDLWHRGDRSHELGPFKFLTRADLKERTSKVQLSRARGVMDKLGSIAISHQLVPKLSVLARLPVADFDIVFDKCFCFLIENHTSNDEVYHCRAEEISYGTIYNCLKKDKRKRKRQT